MKIIQKEENKQKRRFQNTISSSLSILSWLVRTPLKPSRNYPCPDFPRHVSLNKFENKRPYKKRIKILSYNIKHSRKMDSAIKLLRNHKLANADVILLQEMTPEGLAKIAKTLKYNYVYYPAIHHSGLKKDFGNAILSKWPILNDQKIIFPRRRKHAWQRIAVGATVLINNQRVAIFSLHMGIFVKPQQRKKSVNLIIKPLSKDIKHCIVAGDFNSFTKKDRQEITASFTRSHFQAATKDIGWTYKQWYLFNHKIKLDHIYTRGMTILNAGKIINRNPSDHLPIWTELSLACCDKNIEPTHKLKVSQPE